jgi:ribose transport system substrate-binding protein
VPTEIGTKLGNLVVQACKASNLNPCKVGYRYGVKASALDVAIHGAFAKAIAADPSVTAAARGQSFFSPTVGLTAVQNMLQANPSPNLIVGSDQASRAAPRLSPPRTRPARSSSSAMARAPPRCRAARPAPGTEMSPRRR